MGTDISQELPVEAPVAARDRKAGLCEAVVSAVLVAVAFVAMAMVRGNYSVLYPEFVGIELAVALVLSLAVQLLGIPAAERRGAAWATSYVPTGKGTLWTVLSNVAPVVLRAGVLATGLAVVNVLVSIEMYRDPVEIVSITMLMRAVGDFPQALMICALVRALIGWRMRVRGGRA